MQSNRGGTRAGFAGLRLVPLGDQLHISAPWYSRHPWYDLAAGRQFPAFDNEPAPSGTVTDPAPPPAPTGQPSEPFRAFATQKDYDNEAASIRRAAERDAEKKLADALGCSVDEAKQVLADRKAAEEAALTEVQKREKAAQDAQAKADAALAEAAEKTKQATISLALTTAGVRADRVVYASDAVRRELGDNEVTDDAVKAAVETVKTNVAEFFGASGGAAPAPNPAGGPRGGGAPAKSGIEAGREDGRKKREQNGSGDPLEGFRVLGRRSA